MTNRSKALLAPAVLLVTLFASRGELRAQSGVAYQDSFDGYSVAARPAGWVDSVVGEVSARRRSVNTPGGALYATSPDPADTHNIVYGTSAAAGDEQGSALRFGTFSTLTTTNFGETLELTGRMFRGTAATRIGIAFDSSYPEKDSYYLIGLAPQTGGELTMQLVANGAGAISGTSDSGFTPDPGTWIRFHVTVDASGSTTSIRAHFWRDGTSEPAAAAIDATGAGLRPLRGGRIALWSAVEGAAFVDDLDARSSAPPDTPGTLSVSIVSPGANQLIGTAHAAVSGTFASATAIAVNGVPAELNDAARTFSVPDLNLLEGPNTITAVASSASGETATASAPVVVDTRPPELTVTSPASNACLDVPSVDVHGRAFDPSLRSVKLRIGTTSIDAGVAVDGSFTATVPAAAEGLLNITVEAIDALGHASAGTLALSIDRTAPSIDVTESGAALDGLITRKDLVPLARVSDADAHAALTATLDGAAYTTGTAVTAEGDHVLVLTATDCAGHSAQRVLHFTIDRTAPRLLSMTPAPGAVIGARGAISGTTSPDAVSVSVAPFAQTTTVVDGAFTFAGLALAEGANDLTFSIVDRAGNQGDSAYHVTLKSNAPRIDILVDGNVIPAAALFNRTVTPVLRSTDPNATISATLNGQPYAPGTAISDDGSYSLVATAGDSAGHSAQATATFTIDSTPPAVAITEPQSGVTLTTDSVRVGGTVSADAAFVSVNGVTATTAAGTFSAVVPLDAGPNLLVAVARDRAGNLASDQVDLNRTLGPRGIILTSPPDHMTTNRGTTVVTGQVLTSSADATVTLGGNEIAIDANGVFRRNDFPLTDGDNLIVATVRTASGETNQVSVHVTADRTPPRLRLLESGQPLPDGARFPDHAVITAGATDDAGKVTPSLTIDGVAAAQPATITANGGHTIIALARDLAGNEARLERTIFIGAGAAGGCALEAFDPPGGSVVTSNVVTVTGRSGGAAGVKINGSGGAFVANGSFCGTVELPNEGDNSISIVCTDAAGNATGDPVTLVLRRNTGDPSIAISAPGEGSVVAAEVVTVTGTIGAGITSVDVNGVAAVIDGSAFSAAGVRLAAGLNVIAARAHNAAGRIAAASRRIVYLKDAPSISITSPGPSLTTGASSIDVTGGWTNLDPATLAVSGATVQATASNDTFGTFVAHNVPLTAGQQTITVTGRDAAGRTAGTTVGITMTAGAPSIAITDPIDNAIFGSAAAATFDVHGTFAAAPGSNVDVGGIPATIDGTTFAATVPFSTLPSGLTPVIARVTEPSGSESIATIRVQKLAAAPRVLDSFPAAGAVEVDSGALPLVLFSAPMDRLSLASAFRLETSAGAPVTGTIRIDRDVLTFAPAALLTSGGTYTIRVTAAARDLAGNALGSEFTASFSVAASAPGTPPAVLPIDAAVCAQQNEIHGTAAAGSRVRLDYVPLTLNTTADSSGAFTFQVPLSGQSGCQVARVRIVGSDGSLSPATEVRFQVDCNGPRVTGATFDRAANKLAITFSKEMDPSTLVVAQGGSVLLQLSDGRFAAGTATVQANVTTIAPGEDLSRQSVTLSVTTTAKDTSGAKLAFAYTQAFPFEGDSAPVSNNGLGFISGEVYDGDTGRPLAGATVTIGLPPAAPVTSATDARGRYAAQLPEGAHTIQLSAAGYVTVWRQIIVSAGAGVIPIDVRLARTGSTQTAGASELVLTHGAAGTVGLAPAELRAPAGSLIAGTSVSLTSLSAQSLPGLLPLGWSPLAAASIETTATSMSGAQLTFTVIAGDITAAAQTITAIEYHDDRDEWQVVTPAVNAGSDGKVIVPIARAGTYALVYADRAAGLTRPPEPVTGTTLQGVADACADGACPPLTAQSFTIDPPVVLPTGRAIATLKIAGASPSIFPSGTAVQAYVDEELQLADGSHISDPPFTTDLLLYRNLAGDTGVAQLQLAPSSKAAEVVLQVGFDHIRIIPYPGRLDRGTIIGPEGGRVPGDGSVSVEIPAQSTMDALRATSSTITGFASFGSIAGFHIVSGFTLILERADAQVTAPPELLGPARVTFNGIDSGAQYVLVEVLDDTPFGRMFRLAARMVALDGGRLTTLPIDRSVLPLDGVVRDGRYLLLAANAPIAFATGAVRVPASAYVANARVITPALGVADLTRTGGIFNIPVPAAPATPFTLIPRTASTGDGVTFTNPNAPDPGVIVHVGDLGLVLQPPQLATTIPAPEATDVSLTTIVKATFTPAIDPQSVNASSITVVDESGNGVAGNVAAEGSVGVVWTLPPGQRLLPNRRYTATIKATIRGTNGAPFAQDYSFSFSTITQVASTEVHREKIRITIPDSNGHSRVIGDPGALPSSWQAVLIRRGRDFDPRPQATAASDGSFVIDIDGLTTLADLIDLQVINTAGSIAAIYPLTPFVSADGKSFVAPPDRDTRFTSADGTAGVSVPAGAFDEPTTITVTPADHSAFAAVPNIDNELGFSGAVTVDFPGVAKKRLDIELAAPPGSDPQAPYYLGRLGQSVLGPRVEIVDTLRLDNGRFSTTLGSGSASNTAISGARLQAGTSSTFGDPQDAKNAMIATIRGGTYEATKFLNGVSWLLIDAPVTDFGFDVFSTGSDSLFLSGLALTEKRGRTLFPVPPNKPFQLVGYDSSTGLEAFRIDRPAGAALDPLNAIPTAILTANDSGPYPVFASPSRLEIADVPPDTVRLRSIRGLEIIEDGGLVTVSTPPGTSAGPAVSVLDIANGNNASSPSLTPAGVELPGTPGDRLLISLGEKDVDPGQAVAIAFSSPIDLNGLTDPRQVDDYLHAKNWFVFAIGDDPLSLTPITQQVVFSTDPGARRVAFNIPLQRGRMYRITVRGSLSGPPIGGSPGLKLGQRLVSGALVPPAPNDITFDFTVRAPGGEVGRMTLPNSKGGIRDFAMIGNVGLIATTQGGLQAFDISDPASFSSTPPPAPLRSAEGATEYWTVAADRHGRIFAGGLTPTFAVLQTYRIEDFIDPPPPVGGVVPTLAPTAGATLGWRIGINSGVPIGTDILETDRPEGIPRRVQIMLQDDDQTRSRAQLEALAVPGSIHSYGEFDAFDVALPVPGGLKYFKQRITIENRTIGARWSADIQRGQTGVIKGVLAAPGDELAIVRNTATYAVVSLFGYGVGVYDMNAVESNDMADGQPGYTGSSERILLTAARGDLRTDVVYPTTGWCEPSFQPGIPCLCNPAYAAPLGASCEIRDLQFSPDALIFSQTQTAPNVSSSRVDVYALDQRRGLLDMHITPPQTDPGPPPVVQPAQTTMAHGLVLAEPFTAATGGAGVLYHPRLRSLRNLFIANTVSGGTEPRARFTSASPYLRTTAAGTPENYALIAANNFGLLVVKIDGAPLQPQALVDVIWIPAGALSVRVIPRSDLALVVDNAGRILLVDLSDIDETSKVPPLPACTNELCSAELFPTAKKSITSITPLPPPTADWIEVGIDDPRIIWKSAPKTVLGNIPPMIDPDTGILISGDINGDRVAALAAIDPRVQFRIRTDQGNRYVNSIVPLGIAPKDPFVNPESSYGAFRVQVSLPGSIVESLAGTELRFAVESERVTGTATEQTPAPIPPAHLRQRSRDGVTDPRSGALTSFIMRRGVPYDPADPNLRLMRYQRAYNRFLSPWIIAIADLRAGENYLWGSTNPSTQGCFACTRPPSLRGKRDPEAYELLTLGRIISARSETNLFTSSPYAYLGDRDRLVSRVDTVMADVVRTPAVAVAPQNPPVAVGTVQETTYLHSGELETGSVDLDAGGRNGFDVVISRVYRSRSIGFGFFGQGWDSPIFKRVRELPNGNAEVRDGLGDVWEFRRTSGTTYQAPKGVYLTLTLNNSGWSLSDQRKRVSTFDKIGRLVRDADEFFDAPSGSGNAINYLYDSTGRLTTIVDPVGRTTDLSYYATPAQDGLLQSVRDWRGRQIDYKYDARRRLTDVQMPRVLTTDGNIQPTTKYAYVSSAGQYNDLIELEKELTSITDPHEVAASGPARVAFQYAASGDQRDHLITQTWGTGEMATFHYTSPFEASVTDALGQERLYSINGTGGQAQISSMVEKLVMTADAPFGELPPSVRPGVVQASVQDRTWTFTYDPDDLWLKTSDRNGLVKTTNTFAHVGSTAGMVPTSSKTGGAATGTEVTINYGYQSAAGGGAFLLSTDISSPGSTTISLQTPEATRSNVANSTAVESSNDQIHSSARYDRAGRPSAMTSSGGTVPGSNGSTATYRYKSDNSSQPFERGEVASVTEGTALTTNVSYTANETTVTDARGISTTTTYDLLRRPIAITRSGSPGSRETFEYDASGHLRHQTELQGTDTITTTYEYDAVGRQTSVTRDHADINGSLSSVTTRFEYDLPARKTVTHLPTGGTITRELDGVGRIGREVTATGGSPIEHRYAYDIASNTVYSTDMKIATASAFDPQGREIVTLNPDGTRTVRDPDPAGRPKSVETKSAAGATVARAAFSFSDLGRLAKSDVSVDATAMRSSQFAWDGGGRTAASSVAGRAALRSFDTDGSPLSAQAGEGSTSSLTTTFVDQQFSAPDGRLPRQILAREKSGASYTLGRNYDSNANVTRDLAGSLEWKQQFDQSGNLVSSSEPQRPPSTYAYDSRGAITTDTKPDGATDKYAYDSSGALKRYTDPSTESTSGESDLIGRPLKRIYADGTIETFSYDGARLAQYTDRQGRIQNFTYNDRGQLTRIDRNGSPQLDQLDYDDAGRLIRWTNKDSALTFDAFNLDGNPTKTTLIVYKDGTGFSTHTVVATFEQEHQWDEHGERVEWTMPHLHNFTTPLPWTNRIKERRDAMGNLIAIDRILYGALVYAPMLTADYRNAGRPNNRSVSTACGTILCAPTTLVRNYGYDTSTGMLDEMSVSAGPLVVAGTRITAFDGLQLSDAQILGVSGGAHSMSWTYDARSRLKTVDTGRDTTQVLSPSDFRSALERTSRFDPATRAQLAAKGIDVNKLDPPSQTAGEAAGHKVDQVVDGASVRTFSYNGSERNDDGAFAYEFDEKGRLTRATQTIGSPAPLAIMRVTYTYDGNDRMITRKVETAKTSSPTVWSVATTGILTDGIPANAIFVWDPVTDRLVSIFDAATGAISRQIIHGGLGYDDPIEVTLTEPADPSQINRLYPIYDEAGAGHLQAVLNTNGDMVSRKVMAGAYGDDTFSIAGAGIDLVQITANTDSTGLPESLDVTLRSTEELVPATVATGVRLAAVDANGKTVRTTSVTPSLVDPNTAKFTLSAAEWSTLTASAAGVSIAVTSTLRASAWGSDLPVLPAPEWATASLPVFSTTDTPIEVRESLASLSTWLASLGSSAKATTTLYEIHDLALMGSTAVTDDPARFLVSSPFHALPFFDSVTRLSQVRARWLDHSTGTFLTPDPLGYVDSSNLYAFCGGDPVNCSDPDGMRAMTAEDKRQLAMLKVRGKKLYDDFTTTGRGSFRQPMRVPVARKWYDTSGVPGGDYETQMVNATVTTQSAYELAKRTMVNDIATFQEAVARADADGEILYVPGQGFTTTTAADRGRAATTTMVAAGIFFATDAVPMMLSPYGMRQSLQPAQLPQPVSGENRYTRAGRLAHEQEPLPPGYTRTVRLPSGREMDAYNPETRDVIEIKPNTPRQIKRGEKQVQDYCAECNEVYGPGHTGRVQTYEPDPYLRRIDEQQP